jgi:cytochrome b6-f complex iron-sulfur subunit
MSPGIIIAIVAVGLALAAALLVATLRRNDAKRGAGFLSRETVARDEAASSAETVSVASGREVERAAVVSRSQALEAASHLPPAPYAPLDADAVGVSRRHFFNVSAITLMGIGLSGFGAACIAFLWPRLGGGFGSKVSLGKVDDIKVAIRGNKGFFYLAEGRAWITEYPAAALDKARAAYAGNLVQGMEAGIVALYQKCPHLGCRVPECVTSQWFECPCHGSQYNRVGEKKGGPAPRGMDHFAISVAADGTAAIDTSSPINGAAIGTNTTGQEAEGPHCIGAGGGSH